MCACVRGSSFALTQPRCVRRTTVVILEVTQYLDCDEIVNMMMIGG